MLLSCVEKFAIKKSYIVVSNLKNYSKHIKDLGIQKQAYWISNGINLRDMNMQEELPQHIKGLVPKDKFIIGYTGKLGVSNSIIYLLKVARILQNNTNIKFIIVGDGQEKQALVDYANDLNNVIFIDSIPKSNIQSMLSLFDVCYIGWLDKELYKFGIAANKLFDYMYSCKPILHSINTSDSIVNMVGFGCGIKINSEDPEAIVEAITELYATPKNLMKKMGENGKKAILDQFTYHELAKKYLKII